MKIWQCAMFSTLFAWSPQPCMAEAWELAQADTAPVDNLHKNRTPGGSPPTGSALPEAGVKTVDAAEMPRTVDEMLSRLLSMNITYSVPESQLREWLANAEYTPYPAIAAGLVSLLQGRRLKNALDLDVIVYDYESSPGAQSPRRNEDVDQAILTAAIIKGYNARHATSATALSQIIE
ncbi:hypothetical protein J2Y63_000828 [Shinella sp. BE166]|uniref:hypothetical protein n=1 Tax=Shinella sp. BE166 TaxID=3373918 RepID=UPI003EB6CFFE